LQGEGHSAAGWGIGGSFEPTAPRHLLLAMVSTPVRIVNAAVWVSMLMVAQKCRDL